MTGSIIGMGHPSSKPQPSILAHSSVSLLLSIPSGPLTSLTPLCAERRVLTQTEHGPSYSLPSLLWLQPAEDQLDGNKVWRPLLLICAGQEHFSLSPETNKSFPCGRKLGVGSPHEQPSYLHRGSVAGVEGELGVGSRQSPVHSPPVLENCLQDGADWNEARAGKVRCSWV